ncbi:MAG TPA: hypothetical protein VNR89_17535 [Roseomonas sp.]|nr:hypothetical protein [Roseomonas sp.]
MREYRKDEAGVINRATLVSVFCVLLGTIVRAPDAITTLGIASLSRSLTPGNVITLGPIMLAGLMLWQHALLRGLWKAREEMVQARGRPPGEGRRLGLLALFLMPAIAILFIFRQYLREISLREPAQAGCLQPDILGMFFDWGMLHPRGFLDYKGTLVHYCFGSEAQKENIYIYAPIQTWLWVGLAGFSAWLAYKMWRQLGGGTSAHLAT